MFLSQNTGLTKDQRVWVCLKLARVGNAYEVKRRWPNRWPDVNSRSCQTIQATFHFNHLLIIMTLIAHF